MRVPLLAAGLVLEGVARGDLTREMWEAARPVYEKTVKHPFLEGLERGSLSHGTFQFYLVQDGHYLTGFAEVLRKVAEKAPRPEWSAILRRHAQESLVAERDMQARILKDFGLAADHPGRKEAAAPATRAYLAHLNRAASMTFADGLAGVLPCYWIYWEVGKDLARRGSRDAAYQKWIDQYADPAYGKAVEEVLAMMNAAGERLDEAARKRAIALFVKGSELEHAFWEMAWREEGRDPLVRRARHAAMAFTSALPDFVCDQTTLRYYGFGARPRWVEDDRVEAELVYANRRESYRNFRRNGKPLRAADPSASGQWSTGEYGTMQFDLLALNPTAKFRFDRESEVNGRAALKYQYSVEQETSRWRIEFEGKVVYPAYDGAVWIDKETSRVLRIEMAAVALPRGIRVGSAEMTVEYAPFPLQGASYILPARAENLACFRGVVKCSRNETEFKNYRRFSVDSTVTTTDSSVRFEERK